jgi:hypothetical protein
MQVTLKVSDGFNAVINQKNGTILEYSGYVPDFFPEEHYGDYVELDIDLNTGKIVNWKKPTKKQLEKFIGECK